LIGKPNVCGPTLSSFAGDFGLAPLIGKPLAVISDARFCAAFHALRDVMIVLISRLSPADQQEIVRMLLKDSDGWPALAEETNARLGRARRSVTTPVLR
jgi:hypothetical protein